MKLKFRALVALGTVVIFLPSQAMSRNQGVHPITPKQTIAPTFPAFTAAKPPPASVTLQQTINPAACVGGSTAYCDRVDIEIDTPAGYNERYFLDITLSWDASGGNNLGLAWWDSTEEDDVTPLRSDFAANKQPKEMRIEDDPDGTLYFTVTNMAGMSRGYTFKVSWGEDPFLGPLITPTPKPGGATGFVRPTAAPVTIQEEEVTGGGFERPEPTPRTILVPGEDGELQAVTVGSVRGGGRAPPKRPPVDPIIGVVAGVLLLSGSIVGGIAIRNRRRSDAI